VRSIFTGLDESYLVGEDDGLHSITQAELGEYVGHMGLDGLFGDVESCCDLGVG
jgi:hypothetical protein